MDEFIRKLKEKISVDKIVDMMKEAKVIDEDIVKEKDVRATLSKMDINKYVDLEDLSEKVTEKVNQVAEQSMKAAEELGTAVVEAARSTAKVTLSVLTKPKVVSSSYDVPTKRPDEIPKPCEDDMYVNHKNQGFYEYKGYQEYKDYKDLD